MSSASHSVGFSWLPFSRNTLFGEMNVKNEWKFALKCSCNKSEGKLYERGQRPVASHFCIFFEGVKEEFVSSVAAFFLISYFLFFYFYHFPVALPRCIFGHYKHTHTRESRGPWQKRLREVTGAWSPRGTLWMACHPAQVTKAGGGTRRRRRGERTCTVLRCARKKCTKWQNR